MEVKTQHIDIVPLPIDNNSNDKNEEEDTEDEEQSNPNPNNIKKEISMEAPPQINLNPSQKEADFPTDHLSPPPLPINGDMDEPMHANEHKIKTQYFNNYNYDMAPPPSHLPPRSPPKFMALHLRAPPPLTPMSSIASNGTVIGNNYNLPPPITDNNGYIMPPPPPPHGHGHGQYDNISPPSFAIEYKCKVCRISFNTKSDLIGHKQHVHGVGADIDHHGYGGGGVRGDGIGIQQRRDRFYCNVCARSFGGKQHFEYHMRTHSGEKPFKCPTCGKAFRAKHSLKNHLRIHTGERPYQCKVCGKWFRQLGVMKNHIKNMHSR